MAVLILDAGCLIAYERGDQHAMAWIAKASARSDHLAIAVPTLAETWRDGARPARLTRLIGSCRLVDCTPALARFAGHLLGVTGSGHTLDAIVVATAYQQHGAVLTDDESDLRPLGAAAGVEVRRFRPARR